MAGRLYENKNCTADRIDASIDRNFNEQIEATKELISIKSVESQASIGAPYGKGVKDALLKALEISDKLGFETVNIDNQMAYAKFGESEDYYCAIGHVDVVPEGEGWTGHPYVPEIRDNKIYGRGVLDNKGPIISCLYALYALKELGYVPKKEIRIIFGCDEETGFEDLKYYLSKEKAPVFGFTPDCKFPVVYAERGRAIFHIVSNDFLQISSILNEYFLDAVRVPKMLGIDLSDEEYGKNEIRNIKLLEVDGDYGIEFSVSYIPKCTLEYLQVKIIEKIGKASLKVLSNWQPVSFKKDNIYVDKLTKAYEEVTIEDGTPVTTTGGTYAKLMPNILPFGPSFKGQKNIAHLPDEWIDIDDLNKMTKIYARSLKEMGEIE